MGEVQFHLRYTARASHAGLHCCTVVSMSHVLHSHCVLTREHTRSRRKHDHCPLAGGRHAAVLQYEPASACAEPRTRERERESGSTGEAAEPLHTTAHSLMSLASSIVPPMMAAMPPTFSKDTLSPSTVIPMAASAAITTADQTE